MSAGPVIGYRSWRCDWVSYGLSGPVSKQEWPADSALKAKCLPIYQGSRNVSPHITPDSECKCGLYAYHDLHSAMKNYCSNSLAVIGVAAFWGRISVHTAGFRAQYGRTLAICDHTKGQRDEIIWPDVIEGVVERYGIPLLPSDMLEPYGLTFGEQIGTQFEDEE